jgi:hypothetical protein
MHAASEAILAVRDAVPSAGDVLRRSVADDDGRSPGKYRPAVVSSRNRYAPNYVYIDKPPGPVGSAWWLASIALIVDQPVGMLLGERTLGLGWYSPLLGIASWLLYSLWRVENTHIWHSELAHAILAR